MAAAAAEADRLKRENEAQRAASQAELDNAAKQKAQSEAEKAELRVQLLKQFNAILQTRDTARGLIVNMSDVLFDTGKFSLAAAGARETGQGGRHRLRTSGSAGWMSKATPTASAAMTTISSFPNSAASAVRDYLTQQGMAASSVTAKGFGKTQPVASNDTAQGRQQNRRVELVISGEVIGTEIGKVIAAK